MFHSARCKARHNIALFSWLFFQFSSTTPSQIDSDLLLAASGSLAATNPNLNLPPMTSFDASKPTPRNQNLFLAGRHVNFFFGAFEFG
jgi:hypothetical protein